MKESGRASVEESSILVVFSGLPGTGKSRLAEAVGRSLGHPVFAVAWLLGSLGRPDEPQVVYELLTTLASRQLMLGQSAILDGMVGSRQVRDRWRQLADEYDAAFVPIECVCSDAVVHRRRVEDRRDGIPGWADPDWQHVESMRERYEPWSEERLIVDSVKPFEDNLRLVQTYISGAHTKVG